MCFVLREKAWTTWLWRKCIPKHRLWVDTSKAWGASVTLALRATKTPTSLSRILGEWSGVWGGGGTKHCNTSMLRQKACFIQTSREEVLQRVPTTGSFYETKCELRPVLLCSFPSRTHTQFNIHTPKLTTTTTTKTAEHFVVIQRTFLAFAREFCHSLEFVGAAAQDSCSPWCLRNSYK